MGRIALPPLRRALLVGAIARMCGVGMLVALQRRNERPWDRRARQWAEIAGFVRAP